MSTYAFSDLHGQYNLWLQIKQYIKPNDVVYCLGDCIDRGPNGLQILLEVLNTPNITLLRGNHEDFINLMELYSKDFKVTRLLTINGADETAKDFQKLSKEKQIELIYLINNLPTHVEYINKNNNKIYLCHAGMTPKTIEKEHINETGVLINNYIWDRSHIAQHFWKGCSNEYCVHGHTPVLYMYNFIHPKMQPPLSNFEIYKYCNGHKIDIDLGSFETHHTCLLNLDTFEPIYFKDRTFSDKEQEVINNGIK